MTTIMPARETAAYQAGTTPSAGRTGITLGAKIGMSERVATNTESGWDGRTETPITYPMTTSISTGVVTAATSSCRETRAATPAKASQ